jgi:hypothetical protein
MIGDWFTVSQLTAVPDLVTLFRALAADTPAAHQPGLAMALSNLGIHFERASSSREMLASLTEAVEVYKELASRDPDLYQAQYRLQLGTLQRIMSYGACLSKR